MFDLDREANLEQRCCGNHHQTLKAQAANPEEMIEASRQQFVFWIFWCYPPVSNVVRWKMPKRNGGLQLGKASSELLDFCNLWFKGVTVQVLGTIWSFDIDMGHNSFLDHFHKHFLCGSPWISIAMSVYWRVLSGTVTNFDPYRTQAGLDDDFEIRIGNNM